MKICVILLVFLPIFCHGFEFKHHTYTEMVKVLNDVNEKCPEITRRYHLSATLSGDKTPVTKTVQNRQLEVIKMCKNPGEPRDHKTGRPEFKYIGNMHGNEVVSREILLALVDYMCKAYKAGNKTIAWILENTCVHVMPSMNPDGWEIAYKDFKEQEKEHKDQQWTVGRNNAHDVDLNRNFPDLDEFAFGSKKRTDHLEEYLPSDVIQKLEPETMMVIDWIHQLPFILSANHHGGDLVVNFPYDTTIDGSSSRYTASPDNKTFIALAKSYADFNEEMQRNCSAEFEDTMHDCITNGAKWYAVKGGMQDYNYLATNCFETTIELGRIKFPPASLLKPKWEANKDSLINYIAQAHMGIKGIVTDADTGEPIPNARIKVQEITDNGLHPINHAVTSFKGGDYYRLLVDGSYKVTVQVPGYCDESKEVTVTNPGPHDPYRQAQEVDFRLHQCGDRPDSEVFYSNPVSNEYYKEQVLQALKDQYMYSKDSEALKDILEYFRNDFPYPQGDMDDMEKK